MKLYTYWRSQAAFRVRIALNLKGLQGLDLARARTLLRARTIFLDFAVRNGLVSDDDAAATRSGPSDELIWQRYEVATFATAIR